MSEYIFENKDKKEFQDCTGDQMKVIVDGIKDGRVQFFGLSSNRWVEKSKGSDAGLETIYRVLEPEPTPNQIDWSQFPAWVVSCATDFCGKSYIYGEAIPDFIDNTDWRNANIINIVHISDFPGFKRGTVEPKDSLLIRPIGE